MPYFHVLVEHAATRNELSYVIRASSVALAKQEIDNRNLKMVSEMVYLGESKHVIPRGRVSSSARSRVRSGLHPSCPAIRKHLGCRSP